jgi:hypothetical protein
MDISVPAKSRCIFLLKSIYYKERRDASILDKSTLLNYRSHASIL